MSLHLAFLLRSTALLLIVATVFACGAREDLFGPGLPGSGGSGGSGGSTGGSTPARATSVDLLLAIDNSRSMADKQEILSYAVPKLIQSLINPRCIDEDGIPASNQPTGPSSDCPSGFVRQFSPVRDLHVGVVTTSLGDHGGDVCPENTTGSDNNDLGRLISRNATGGSVPTYQSLGFLAWDPDQELSPPGLDDDQRLMGDLTQIVLGAGQVGCGFEALLESWYRFLVDPNPYLTIEEDGSGMAVMEGTDEVVLMQREDFLRPNSLLAVILLSDENDCSMRDGSQYFYVAKATAGAGTYHLPRAQITCTSDPSDPCCRSCGQTDDGCPPKGDECATTHDNTSDQINLRCFDQKRRFGIDFLYPIERYVDALTSAQIADRDGNLEPNPIFSDLNPSDDLTEVRDARLVFLASIQGVPWQDIARRSSSGQPDLETGLNAAGLPVGGFQNAAELSANGVWDVILGDPSHYYADASDRPDDPLMRESVDPRTGSNPITGDALAPPGADYMANPINGHEFTIDQRNDLQYTCIFSLDQPRNCGTSTTDACDCTDANNDNPLCQNSSNDFGTIQYSAKAYPGLRQAELVRELGGQAVIGSICPAQTNSPNSLDFGYVPTIRTLVESIGPRLNQP